MFQITDRTFRKSLYNAALIRELHVYGKLVPTYLSKIETNNQHQGLGGKLLKRAEEIAIENSYDKIAIISVVGVREYYKKKGYYLDDSYMVKDFYQYKPKIIYIITLIFLIITTSIISIIIITRFLF